MKFNLKNVTILNAKGLKTLKKANLQLNTKYFKDFSFFKT
jgi:ferredoxin-fold anticodon binding domain-containing protein